jgi:gliding motility-associated-like protein
VKEGYQSIVSFEAKVFDRWGKCLYTWTDLAGGWDGRSGGREVPDGAYYLHIKARGADGRKYNIKKVINVLRRYTENMGGG